VRQLEPAAVEIGRGQVSVRSAGAFGVAAVVQQAASRCFHWY
jgi:hypothetical protein